MRAVDVTENISWVGAIDWSLRDFHGFETPNGTTYNAYLVRGENGVALIDTVKKPFVPELLTRVASVLPLEQVTHIIVNHIEPDHNGGLPEVMQALPQARVVASPSGARGVAEYHNGLAIEAVKPDDVIDLGGKTLHFLPQPMVHWPDSMFTYCPEVKTLMPNDAFGQHVASEERFADEYGLDGAIRELGIYYANILLPLGAQVAKAVEKVAGAGWQPEIIAPSHGLIWRGDTIPPMLEAYERWTSGIKADKAIVVFSTMWGSTEALAHAVAEGIGRAGVATEMHDLAITPIAHIVADLLDAKGLALGSPTLHHGMLYRVAGFLQYVAGLKPEGRVAGTFGSYGWSKGAEKQMREKLEEIGFELPLDDFLVKFRPTPDDLVAAEAWGHEFAEAVKAHE